MDEEYGKQEDGHDKLDEGYDKLEDGYGKLEDEHGKRSGWAWQAERMGTAGSTMVVRSGRYVVRSGVTMRAAVG